MDMNATGAKGISKATIAGVAILILIVGGIAYLSKRGQNSESSLEEKSEMSTTTESSTTKSGAVKTTAPSVKKTTTSGVTTKTQTTVQTNTVTVPSTPSTMSTPTAQKVAVRIEGSTFTPSVLEVKKGTTVIWTNFDTIQHSVTGDDNVVPGSGLLLKGESYSYTFDKVGEFPYHCQPHTFMHGTVKVIE
jgi:plastocyanin